VTDIPIDERKRNRQAAAQAEIAITSIHWLQQHTEGMFLTLNDPAVRER